MGVRRLCIARFDQPLGSKHVARPYFFGGRRRAVLAPDFRCSAVFAQPGLAAVPAHAAEHISRRRKRMVGPGVLGGWRMAAQYDTWRRSLQLLSSSCRGYDRWCASDAARVPVAMGRL